MKRTKPPGADIADVSKVVCWFDRATGVQLIRIGLALIAVSLVSATLGRSTGQAAILAVMAAGGFAMVIWGFAADAQPGRPYLALSPDGLSMSSGGKAEFIVPWSEITAVDLTDFEARVFGNSGALFRSQRYKLCKDVTAVSVPRAFYDAEINRYSAFRRGPGWENVFAERGDVVKIILHAEIMDAAPQDIFRAVEARWKAFGGRAAAKGSG
jgi:hypothetical protein